MCTGDPPGRMPRLYGRQDARRYDCADNFGMHRAETEAGSHRLRCRASSFANVPALKSFEIDALFLILQRKRAKPALSRFLLADYRVICDIRRPCRNLHFEMGA